MSLCLCVSVANETMASGPTAGDPSKTLDLAVIPGEDVDLAPMLQQMAPSGYVPRHIALESHPEGLLTDNYATVLFHGPDGRLLEAVGAPAEPEHYFYDHRHKKLHTHNVVGGHGSSSRSKNTHHHHHIPAGLLKLDDPLAEFGGEKQALQIESVFVESKIGGDPFIEVSPKKIMVNGKPHTSFANAMLAKATTAEKALYGIKTMVVKDKKGVNNEVFYFPAENKDIIGMYLKKCAEDYKQSVVHKPLHLSIAGAAHKGAARVTVSVRVHYKKDDAPEACDYGSEDYTSSEEEDTATVVSSTVVTSSAFTSQYTGESDSD